MLVSLKATTRDDIAIVSGIAIDAQASAENGIKSVQTNSPQEARYERKDASDGRFYFNLKAGNHQVIGTSQLYKDAAGRDNGIQSVQAHGPSTTVKKA